MAQLDAWLLRGLKEHVLALLVASCPAHAAVPSVGFDPMRPDFETEHVL